MFVSHLSAQAVKTSTFYPTYPISITLYPLRIFPSHQVALLVAGLRRDCQEVILEGCSGVVWESYKVDPFVKKMAEQFYAFQDKVEELLQIDEEVITLSPPHYIVSIHGAAYSPITLYPSRSGIERYFA